MDGGEPGNNTSLLARWGHSYPAEQGVPDQDASCRANRLGWRDLSLATAVNSVQLRSHATPARSAHRRCGRGDVRAELDPAGQAGWRVNRTTRKPLSTGKSASSRRPRLPKKRLTRSTSATGIATACSFMSPPALLESRSQSRCVLEHRSCPAPQVRVLRDWRRTSTPSSSRSTRSIPSAPRARSGSLPCLAEGTDRRPRRYARSHDGN